MQAIVTMLQNEFTAAHEKAKAHPLFSNYNVKLVSLDGFVHHGKTFVTATFSASTCSNNKTIDLFDNLGYLDDATDFARIETITTSLEK